ncbi:MAG TPA: carboxypeptidase regulatory-like domain-containing protein, partial [Candidatus Cloacimonadota bacterium]|nr:carboxypeptidase regulatory-like domain-containing protein [Candidatus Cloacimonadota bacterium]
TTTKNGFNDQHTTDVVLTINQTTIQNIIMTPMTNVTISGQVNASNTSAGLGGVTVKLVGYENYEVVTDANGLYTIPNVYSGQTYTQSFLKPGYMGFSQPLVVGTENIVVPTVTIEQNPSFLQFLVGNAESTSEANNYPANFYYKNSLSQMIYMQSELNDIYQLAPGNPIVAIKYFANLNGTIPADKPLKVWMANTNLSTFATTSSWIPADQFTLVWDSTVDLSATGLYELTLELNQPFPYNGENLVIMVNRPMDDAYYGSANKWKNTATPAYPNRTIYRQSDSVVITPEEPGTGTLASNVPNTFFTFNTAGFASLNGTITSNGAPLEGVRVAIDGTTRFAISDAQGNYAINYVFPGTINLTATKHGYYDYTATGLVLTAEQTLTHNFTINQLPVVTVNGQINGSDTGAGLAGAIVSLTGYEPYQTSTAANGSFSIPSVYASQTYSISVTKEGYQEYTAEVAVGITNHTIPTIVLSEIAYPASNVYAEASDTQVVLTWDAPVIPTNSPANNKNSELRRESSSSVLKNTPLKLGKSEINLSHKDQINLERSITGYNIWRAPLNALDDQNLWTSIQNNVNVLTYTDPSWAQVASGEFKYAVSAVYTGGVLSEPAFSNTIAKNMMALVTINLATADGQSPAGALITLINQDQDPEHVYTSTATSNVVTISNVWLGTYTLRIAKTGYVTYENNNVIIAGTEYNHPLVTLEVSNVFFTEDFEGATFPPQGWTSIDADQDSYNWQMWDIEGAGYNSLQCAASASYLNNVGALTPDNYLITPAISLQANGSEYTLNYWVSAQDPAYAAEHYSILVSNTGTNIADFTSIYSETLTSASYEQRSVNLNNYIGQTIYIAFRHHDVTDMYWMKIDQVEINRTLSQGNQTPEIKQTVLKGNYPNPFNPVTNISFDLVSDELVKVDIFNAKGQKVKTLLNEQMKKGSHTIQWNGTDDLGKNVGSGIYFYNMRSGKYTSTRKMILMK